MTVIMREAIKPNLLQTLENTPVLVHAGPFGNIAHGNSSVVADLIGIHGGDYLVTEAGFGADMGAEKFFNIKCRASGLTPDAAVVVTTVRALKAHSGRHKIVAGRALPPEALLAREPRRRCTWAPRTCASRSRTSGCTASRPWSRINAFPDDHPSEHPAMREIAAELGVRSAVCTHFAEGGKGADRARRGRRRGGRGAVGLPVLYPDEASLREKIETVATKVYGADGVDYSPAAAKQLDNYESNGFGTLPVCIAKTHLSISSDPTLLGAPTGWRLPVRRGPRERRGGLHLPDLRRHAHHARPRHLRRPPSASTSTPTVRSSACRESRLPGPAMTYAFLDQPLSVFLDRVASDEPAPGGGACAAVTVGLAAGLCAMAARFSAATVADAGALAEQADALRSRVQGLAEQDAEAYTQVLQAFRLPKEPDGDARRERISAALAAAAEPPLAVAEAAVEVGGLARRLEAEGNPNLRGDALTGRLLAEAGCRAAAELVAANLPEGAPRRQRAEALAASWSGAT